MKPFIIAIAGGSGSGKTTLAEKLAKELHATLISTDNYYNDLSYMPRKDREDMNFDHPDSVEWTLLEEHIRQLSEGRTIDMPQYEFSEHTRKNETVKVNPCQYIIVEGILALHDEQLNKNFDYKIYVDVPERIRYDRRLKRDVKKRDRTEESILYMWNKNVKPMHDKYVEPSKAYADIVVDNDDKYIKLIKEKIVSSRK